MALGIYKPEQGYWMRVLTACLIAAVTLATAGWLWDLGPQLADKLPRSIYAMAINVTAGEPKPGQAIELLGVAPTPDAPAPKIGTAETLAFNPDGRVLKVTKLVMDDKYDPAQITGIRAGEALAAGVIPRTVKAQDLVEPLYIQITLAGVAILVGTALAYYICAIRQGTVEFLIATDSEMKRVNWSTPREIRGSTLVVIGACFTIAGALFLFDIIFQTLFKAGGVLAP